MIVNGRTIDQPEIISMNSSESRGFGSHLTNSETISGVIPFYLPFLIRITATYEKLFIYHRFPLLDFRPRPWSVRPDCPLEYMVGTLSFAMTVSQHIGFRARSFNQNHIFQNSSPLSYHHQSGLTDDILTSISYTKMRFF